MIYNALFHGSRNGNFQMQFYVSFLIYFSYRVCTPVHVRVPLHVTTIHRLAFVWAEEQKRNSHKNKAFSQFIIAQCMALLTWWKEEIKSDINQVKLFEYILLSYSLYSLLFSHVLEVTASRSASLYVCSHALR